MTPNDILATLRLLCSGHKWVEAISFLRENNWLEEGCSYLAEHLAQRTEACGPNPPFGDMVLLVKGGQWRELNSLSQALQGEEFGYADFYQPLIKKLHPDLERRDLELLFFEACGSDSCREICSVLHSLRGLSLAVRGQRNGPNLEIALYSLSYGEEARYWVRRGPLLASTWQQSPLGKHYELTSPSRPRLEEQAKALSKHLGIPFLAKGIHAWHKAAWDKDLNQWIRAI
jgi:hypothetical protein